MSDEPGAMVRGVLRDRTLARFEEHRRVWRNKPSLQMLYREWYRRVRRALPDAQLGPWIELGSGPGFAGEFIPEMILTDIVQAPWHARQVSADALPFADASIGALVLFDVLHHLAAPVTFLSEATRVLRPGGRIVLCEPYVSPVSAWAYRRFHEEPVNMSTLALVDLPQVGKDPFASNQAIPTLIFARDKGRGFSERFPHLRLAHVERLAGLAYPASGGFSRSPLLPLVLWKILFAIEKCLPAFVYRLIGFRMLVVVERVSTP